MIPWPVAITLFFLGGVLGAAGVAWVACAIVLRCLEQVVVVESSITLGSRPSSAGANDDGVMPAGVLEAAAALHRRATAVR